MRQTLDLLVATTNEGKYNEIRESLADLPFFFHSLKDIPEAPPEPEETEPTLEGNAMLKARYYGDKTGLLTMADDTGLFIDALGGWPGVRSARVAPTAEERCAIVLENMRVVPKEKRGAYFQAVVSVHDPRNGNTFLSTGKTQGTILFEPTKDRTAAAFGYDPLFFAEEAGRCYAELPMHEKLAVSHRGKAMNGIKWTLINEYGAKHIVAALALILRGGKILMSLRNDPHRPQYHRTWEFPGGGVDAGETISQSLIRECREEVGYEVEIIRRLDYIGENCQVSAAGRAVQVFLLLHICRVSSGDGRHSDLEVLETRWFELDDALNYPLMGNNKEIYAAILPELKQYA